VFCARLDVVASLLFVFWDSVDVVVSAVVSAVAPVAVGSGGLAPRNPQPVISMTASAGADIRPPHTLDMETTRPSP